MIYDAIVVGGGVSGLLSTLALSKEGKKVLLLEKDPQLGGVLRSYNVDGYRVDTGTHIITRLERGPLKDLMRDYFDITPVFIPHGKYYVRLSNEVRAFPWNLRDWMAFDVIPPVDRLYLMKTLFSISHVFTPDLDLNAMTVQDLVGDGIAPETKRFLDCLCGFLSGGTTMNETPVARFIDAERYKTISEGYLDKLYKILMKEGGTDQTYPKNGIQALTDAIVSSIGGLAELKTNEEVTSIELNDKGAVVSTKDNNYKAKFVVYSGFASDLPNLVDSLPKSYSSSISQIRRINTMTTWLGFKKKIFTEQGSEMWADKKPYFWVVPTSNYDSSLAPKGKQLAGFAHILPEKFNQKKEEKRALDTIYSTMPALERNVEFKHTQTLVPEKAVWTAGAEFAKVKTPLKRLYLVGTDTEKKSMGVTRASYSVMRLLDTLRKDKFL